MSQSAASRTPPRLALALALVASASAVSASGRRRRRAPAPSTVVRGSPADPSSESDALGRRPPLHVNPIVHSHTRFELPLELAEMIAAAETQPRPSPDSSSGDEIASPTRYYAAYAEGKPCASKPIAEFERWDESFESLEECCGVSFSWDYDACMGF